MTKKETEVKTLSLETRDALILAALKYTDGMKGTKQDRAVFDYLCGAVNALFATGLIDTEVPPFLWVLGVRGGARIEECKRMVAESIKAETADQLEPAKEPAQA